MLSERSIRRRGGSLDIGRGDRSVQRECLLLPVGAQMALWVGVVMSIHRVAILAETGREEGYVCTGMLSSFRLCPVAKDEVSVGT